MVKSWHYRTKKKTIVNGAVRANVGTIDQVEANGVNNISGEELNALSGASGNIQEQLSALSENLSDLGKNGGGLSYKRKLTANDHLNDVLEDGLYDLAAGDIPSDIPDGYANMNGMLVVETAQAVSTTIQTLYMFNNGIHDVWSRRHWPSGWSDWTKWAMETNASAQAMLNKTPVSADTVTDADGIFGSHNGNFVTRSLSKLWDWIVTHLANGVLGNILVKAPGVTERGYYIQVDTAGTKKAGGCRISNAKNLGIYDDTLSKWLIVETPNGYANVNVYFQISPTGVICANSTGVPTMYLQKNGSNGSAWGAIQKYIDGSTDGGTHLVDRTNNVNTDFKVQNGSAWVQGSEVLRVNNLLTLFPGIVTGDNALTSLLGKVPVLWRYGTADACDAAYEESYLNTDNIQGLCFLCIGWGSPSSATNTGASDWCNVVVVCGVYGSNYCKWHRITCGSTGSTTRTNFYTVNPTSTVIGEFGIKVPKGSYGTWTIYKLKSLLN